MLKRKVRRVEREEIYLLINKHPTESQKNQVSLDNATKERQGRNPNEKTKSAVTRVK